MSQALQAYSITAPGFYGLNTQDSSVDLSSGFALVANNCIIDRYGRIGSRKGWTKQNTALNTDAGTNPIKCITELIADDGTPYVLAAADGQLLQLNGSSLTTLTYGGGGTAPTITDSNWQAAFINGYAVFYQIGHDPLVFNPDVSTTTYRRISESSGYSGTVQQANCVIAAYGRTWSANTNTDKQTIQWSDLSQPFKFSGGTSGTLDTHQVWPKGSDTVTALAAHNGFLYIFGYNNILIYQGATDPSTMSLYDVVTGIGCIARDSVANTGTDIVFLSSTGVRSLMRTIQEKSAPLRDLSKNVRDDLIDILINEDKAAIKAIYSPLDGFYVMTLPSILSAYCFDMKAAMQDGSARVTTWDGITPQSFCRKADGTLLIGKNGYIGKYEGYLDNGASYRLQYYTNYSDFGQPVMATILKKIIVSVVGGSNQPFIVKWDYDFKGQYQSFVTKIPTQRAAKYNISEYNTEAEYSSGILIRRLTAYPNGFGQTVQTGYETDVNDSAISIQKIEIYAKNGKIA
jgi:hypothetical protein